MLPSGTCRWPDTAPTLEDRMIAADEFIAGRNVIRLRTQRVRNAIVDPDPKFSPLRRRREEL
jgi:hypothetical protein